MLSFVLALGAAFGARFAMEAAVVSPTATQAQMGAWDAPEMKVHDRLHPDRRGVKVIWIIPDPATGVPSFNRVTCVPGMQWAGCKMITVFPGVQWVVPTATAGASQSEESHTNAP